MAENRGDAMTPKVDHHQLPKPVDHLRYGDRGVEITVDQAKLQADILRHAQHAGLPPREALRLAETKVFFDKAQYYRHIAEVYRQKTERSLLKGFAPILKPDLFAKALDLSDQFLIELGGVFSDKSGPAILLKPDQLHAFLERHPEMSKPHAIMQETMAKTWMESTDLLVKLQDKRFNLRQKMIKSGKFAADYALSLALTGGQALIINNFALTAIGFPLRNRITKGTLALAEKSLTHLLVKKQEKSRDEVVEKSRLFHVHFERVDKRDTPIPLPPLSSIRGH